MTDTTPATEQDEELDSIIGSSETYGIFRTAEYQISGDIGDLRAQLLAWRNAYAERKVVEAFDKGWEARDKEEPPRLVDAIEFRREQYGWNDSKMAAMLDLSRAHYSEFKSGKRGLPVNSIRKAYAIGVPASVLLAEQVRATIPPKPEEGQ